MLTPEHIEQLDATRKLLQKLENETLSEERYPYGRFGEACRSADDAIFQVVLISRHWLEPEISEAQREEERV